MKTLPDDVEAVVVGLGAGGGMAFHTLAEAGVDVAAFEIGERLPAADRNGREESMVPKLFAEGGARASNDMGISIIQGKGVGGSTLHNTNLIARIGDETRHTWAREYGLSDPMSQLDDYYAYVEETLSIGPVSDAQVNQNNRVFERGAKAKGWHVERMNHNRVACKGSGLCTLGCPNNAKQTSASVLIPCAEADGGRLFENARVDRIHFAGDRVSGVDVFSGGRMKHVTTRAVFLAGSATSSSALARVSGAHPLAGERLHLHPGTTVAGRFSDEAIEGWIGIPQSVSSREFMSEGAWLVPGFAHPGAASMFVPGFGQSHFDTMTNYGHLASVIIMLHDSSSGSVRRAHVEGTDEVLDIAYTMNRADQKALKVGILRASELLLAAGADEVYIPTFPPQTIRSERELKGLKIEIGLMSPALTAVHPMSSMWMGEDPKASVVDPRGQVHGKQGLYVVDSSLFPTSIGGPPQLTIFALARYVAQHALRQMGST